MAFFQSYSSDLKMKTDQSNLANFSQRETMLPEDSEVFPRSPQRTGPKIKRTPDNLEERLYSPVLSTHNGFGGPQQDTLEEENPMKQTSLLWDSLGEYSSTEEDSNRLTNDTVQWKLSEEIDLPDNFKREINLYKRSGESYLRLARKINGSVGCLYYVLKNRLLMWFFEEGRQFSCDFDETINEVVITSLIPNTCTAGVPRCVMIASLETKVVFKTVIRVGNDYALIEHCPPLNAQVDGIYYDEISQRVFMAKCDSQKLVEAHIKAARPCSISQSEQTIGRPRELIKQISASLFKRYSYRTHMFSCDRRPGGEKRLYQVLTKWASKGRNSSEISSQSIHVYSLYEGVIVSRNTMDLQNMLESSRGDERQRELAKKQARSFPITGIAASQGENWDLTVMFQNGFQIRLQVLEGSSNGGQVQCKLYQFIGSRVLEVAEEGEETPAQSDTSSLRNSLYGPVPFGRSLLTSGFAGLENAKTFVHKCTRRNASEEDGSLTSQGVRLYVQNRLNLTTSAQKFNSGLMKMYQADPLISHSVSRLISDDSYVEDIDTEVVVDSLANVGVAGKMWEDLNHGIRQFESPVIRAHTMAIHNLRDRVCVAFGHKVLVYERLNFKDVLYCIIWTLDQYYQEKAKNPEINEMLSKVLKWDLMLMASKIGLVNLSSACLSLLLSYKNDSFIKSKSLFDVYKNLAQGFDVSLKEEDYLKLDNNDRVRKLILEVLRELGDISQTDFALQIASSCPLVVSKYNLVEKSVEVWHRGLEAALREIDSKDILSLPYIRPLHLRSVGEASLQTELQLEK